jgi:peptide/nickel transport system permease protein
LLAYLANRLLHGLVVITILTVVVFFLIHASGDPLAKLRANPRVSKGDIQRLEKQMGLDKPVYIQYFYWLRDSFTRSGEWAKSFSYNEPVYSLILDRFLNTLLLVFLAIAFALSVAIPLGVWAALKRYSLFDISTTFLSYLGLSIPVFWLGLILQLVFGFYLWKLTGIHLFYTASMYSPGHEYDLINRLQHLVLPVLTLSLALIAGWSRYQRASMQEVLTADYLVAARARGLSERNIIFKHALKNALIPVVTMVALDSAALMGGAVVTETVFAWPGIGRLFYNALLDRDYPLVMANVIFLALMVILLNFLADIVYAYLDPRIRYRKARAV